MYSYAIQVLGDEPQLYKCVFVSKNNNPDKIIIVNGIEPYVYYNYESESKKPYDMKYLGVLHDYRIDESIPSIWYVNCCTSNDLALYKMDATKYVLGDVVYIKDVPVGWLSTVSKIDNGHLCQLILI